jgi:6-phosphogluconolactonase/glucosamine-6-phosphate isomerase/deaminase
MGVFDLLAADVRKGTLSLSKTHFVSLDEWIGVPPDNPGSCRAMMNGFFREARLREDQITFFNGLAEDPNAEAESTNKLIAQHGGLDIMLVGIGLNGHIAMNEPGTAFDRYAHVSQLSPQTIEVGQKYFTGETKLSRGITLGLGHFREAKLPILMANGPKKADVIQKAIRGPVTFDVPASIVQTIPAARVMVDGEAGEKLKRKNQTC